MKMAAAVPIFTLPIPAYKSSTHASPAGGTFALTLAAPKVYLLTFNSAPDNRLTSAFLTTFNLALDIITTKLPPGVLITTSAVGKYYSSGLDYPAASADPDFMPRYLYPLWKKLLTFPWYVSLSLSLCLCVSLSLSLSLSFSFPPLFSIEPEPISTPPSPATHQPLLPITDPQYKTTRPTVALINGSAHSAGLTTALAHDYRIMPSSSSSSNRIITLSHNEVIFNAPLTPAISTLYRTKLSNISVFRALVLEAKSFDGGNPAFNAGIVDATYSSSSGDGADAGIDECLAMIESLGLTATLRAAGVGSYGLIKEEMYREIIADLDLGVEGETRVAALRARERELRRKAAKHRVKNWVAQGGHLGSS